MKPVQFVYSVLLSSPGFIIIRCCMSFFRIPSRIAQSVTCLTADPGVGSSIPAWSYTFAGIDHEIISTSILPSADSRRVVVSYKQKYVHEVLVNPLVKLDQEKVWLGELTVPT